MKETLRLGDFMNDTNIITKMADGPPMNMMYSSTHTKCTPN